MTIEPPCAVISPMRAAGRLLIITVSDPFTIVSGGPTQVAMSVTRAAGILPIRTVTAQGGRIGPPTCGIGGTPGVTIGQTCISPTRAAGIPMMRLLYAVAPAREDLLRYRSQAGSAPTWDMTSADAFPRHREILHPPVSSAGGQRCLSSFRDFRIGYSAGRRARPEWRRRRVAGPHKTIEPTFAFGPDGCPSETSFRPPELSCSH
jgi:hypothetical protein